MKRLALAYILMIQQLVDCSYTDLPYAAQCTKTDQVSGTGEYFKEEAVENADYCAKLCIESDDCKYFKIESEPYDFYLCKLQATKNDEFEFYEHSDFYDCSDVTTDSYIRKLHEKNEESAGCCNEWKECLAREDIKDQLIEDLIGYKD